MPPCMGTLVNVAAIAGNKTSDSTAALIKTDSLFIICKTSFRVSKFWSRASLWSPAQRGSTLRCRNRPGFKRNETKNFWLHCQRQPKRSSLQRMGKGVASWTRLRWRVSALREEFVHGANLFALGVKTIDRSLPDDGKGQLVDGRFLFLLFFGRTALLDDLAERTWMLAVESLAYCLSEGSVTRIGNDHTRPRHRLQQRPLQPQGEDQNKNGDGAYKCLQVA